jgi:phosphoribosylformylglycinamidine synthase
LGETDVDDLGGSEYLWRSTGEIGDRPPKLDLDREVAVQALVRSLIADGVVHSAHDCSEGGLGVALAESCFASDIDDAGVEIDVDVDARADLWLFCESPSRIIVSVSSDDADAVLASANDAGVPAAKLGKVTSHGQFGWGETLRADMSTLREAWASGLSVLDD